MRTMKMGFAAVLVSTVMASNPASAAVVDRGPGGPERERAEQLRKEAETYFSQPKQWRRAARLLERSAELRAADDADAYSNWVMAGSLRAAMGDYASAASNYQKAADQALARGAVLDAAHAMIDGAHAAAQMRDGQQAVELVERARLLASSPMLTADQAEQIIRRIQA